MITEPRSALTCRNISVRYGDVAALTDVSVAFAPKLIHAVVGQNGAGKTTFARVVAGIVQPGLRGAEIDGRDVPPATSIESRAAGVELVHQSFALPPSFTVAEAMEFGARRRPADLLAAQARGALERHISQPRHSARDSATAFATCRSKPQQSVEIARALVTDARVLILDEPTAVLSPTGVEALCSSALRGLKASGVTIILVLHKIREVLAIADTVTVLRGGRLIAGADRRRRGGRRASFPQLIIGAEAEQSPDGDATRRRSSARTARRSAAAAAARSRPPAGSRLPTRFDARAIAEGPALGERHVSPSRRARSSASPASKETASAPWCARSPGWQTRRPAGSPRRPGRDRLHSASAGPAGCASFRSSATAKASACRARSGRTGRPRAASAARPLSLISPARFAAQCDVALKHWDVRYSTTRQPAGSLSGGNAQKLILAREIDEDARLIIAAQPTRGLDVGATAFVWKSLRDAHGAGMRRAC